MGRTTPVAAPDPWGPYPNYQDIARLEYGRMLWKSSEPRAKLLAHWLAPSHPYSARFQRMRAVIEEVLSFTGDDCELDARLRDRSMSLRAVVREIPPVFGSI